MRESPASRPRGGTADKARRKLRTIVLSDQRAGEQLFAGGRPRPHTRSVSHGAASEKILIVRLSAMGDVLQTLPAFSELRAARPEAELGWVVERRFASLLEGHPSIDRLFVFERSHGGGIGTNIRALLRLRAELRAWGPTVAVDAQGNLRGALVVRLSGAARRVALAPPAAREGSARFANEIVPASDDPREHRGDQARRLFAPLRRSGPSDPSSDAVLAAELGGTAELGTAGAAAGPLLPPISDDIRQAVTAALDAAGLRERPFALLIAGTSAFGAFKRWPAAHFGALAQRLRDERGLAVLVSYGPGQESLARKITAASDGAATPAPATGSLMELRAQIEAAALVVGADSGPVVLAGLIGRPTVALFGPKDPAIYRPPGSQTTAVWKGVYCAPCKLRKCDDPICMTLLDPDDAWRGVQRALPRPRETVA